MKQVTKTFKTGRTMNKTTMNRRDYSLAAGRTQKMQNITGILAGLGEGITATVETGKTAREMEKTKQQQAISNAMAVASLVNTNTSAITDPVVKAEIEEILAGLS